MRDTLFVSPSVLLDAPILLLPPPSDSAGLNSADQFSPGPPLRDGVTSLDDWLDLNA
jgi:hypothetical protein